MAYLLNCLEVPKSYLPEVGSLPSGTQVGKDDERMHGIPPMSTFYNDLAGAHFTLLCTTTCLASLLLGTPLAIHTLDHLKEGPLNK